MRILYGLALIAILYLRTPNLDTGINNMVTLFILIVAVISIFSFFINKRQQDEMYNEFQKLKQETYKIKHRIDEK